MDVFEIRMLPDGADAEFPGYRRCQIRMGLFCESFLADMALWSERMYEDQWLTALEYIADHEKSALIASFGEAHVRWWAMYSFIRMRHCLQVRGYLGWVFRNSDRY